MIHVRCLPVSMRRETLWLVAGGMFLLLTGCPRRVEPPVAAMELEPMYFTMVSDGGKDEVRSLGEEEMLEEAIRLLNEGAPLEAKKLFSTLVEHTRSSALKGVAMVHMAWCDLALDSPGEALRWLDAAMDHLSDPANRLTAQVVRVQALGMLGRWKEVVVTAEALRRNPELEKMAMVTVLDYLGRARGLEGKLELAEEHFLEAAGLLLDEVPIVGQYRNRTLAGLYYRLGELYRDRLETIRLRLPVERMTVDMADKLALMRKGEELYMASVRVRDPEYSALAGMAVSGLYRRFSHDLLGAEVPGDLTDLELEIYQQELARHVVPFLERAVHLLEQTVEMARLYQFPQRQRVRASELLEETLGELEVQKKLAKPAESGSRP
jgi:hypothetical protein